MARLDRAFIEARIEGLLAEAHLLIGRLDDIDGDADLEENGDAEDNGDAEREEDTLAELFFR